MTLTNWTPLTELRPANYQTRDVTWVAALDELDEVLAEDLHPHTPD